MSDQPKLVPCELVSEHVELQTTPAVEEAAGAFPNVGDCVTVEIRSPAGKKMVFKGCHFINLTKDCRGDLTNHVTITVMSENLTVINDDEFDPFDSVVGGLHRRPRYW